MQALFPILLLVAMYVMLIRPQQARAKAHRALIAALGVGDEVVTAGGILGTIVDIDGDKVGLQVAPDTRIVVLRPAITNRVPDDADDEDTL